ncbi:hypothetical protein GXP67_35825 [Rhodocytophaga rosea]|uniref:ATP-grasp domain-containing protein n=1 Tax=Rhodocytophaga rosea TaxID=2704465 RepID=A0A6C0GWI4_9BACT|nr:hypothetical protein [Rhodocytophaga rosea]QHT71660.1 hypothetical protein GXP67_35825 [Rhodocytophaga rosea]
MLTLSKFLPASLRGYITPYKDSFYYWLIHSSIEFKEKNKKNKVIFYPDYPGCRHLLGRIFRCLNYEITNDISAFREARFIVNWEDTTFRTPYRELLDIADSREIINIRCQDISKKHVDEVFERVFGYKTIIDPTTFRGKCVKKSDINALHDGTIINCPIEIPEPGFIYQMLINNQLDDFLIEDIRTPIFRDTIPFTYVKHRPVKSRFASKNNTCVITDTKQVFTQQEINNIITFSQEMCLDFGELDILRDRENGKIYIVDVNNTPGGPPNGLSRVNTFRAIKMLTLAFIEAFIERESRPASKQIKATSKVIV